MKINPEVHMPAVNHENTHKHGFRISNNEKNKWITLTGSLQSEGPGEVRPQIQLD